MTPQSVQPEVVFFDLDDTLVVEEASAEAAFMAAGALARERYRIDPKALAAAVRRQAGELWRAAPTIRYCRAIGVSSWEGLWAEFLGESSELHALRAWAPTYRREAWRRALEEFGVQDESLTADLAATFPRERRARHLVFTDVEDCLQTLRQWQCRLAVVTNGVSDLQREKLRGAGLEHYFETVFISGELGVGKPDPRIYHIAVEQLRIAPAQAVMVGDSLPRDVAAAQQAGLRTVWLNRTGLRPAESRVVPDVEISSLEQLPASIAAADTARRERAHDADD